MALSKNGNIKNIENICNRLEKLHQSLQLTELFTGQALIYREKLKDLALCCLFNSNYDQYKDIDLIIWRKVFYEPIQLLKKYSKKKDIKILEIIEKNEDKDIAFWLYKNFLLSSIGYYQHVLMCCQTGPQAINLTGIIDIEYNFDPEKLLLNNLVSGNALRSDSTSEFLKIQSIAHQTLIYLGDLARYYSDIDDSPFSFHLAARYYHQAILLCPDLGMPHSQLGTLLNTKYEGVSSIFHYMNCTMSNQSFEGAHANLRRVFERIRPIYAERMNQPDRFDFISNLMIKFVYLLDSFYNEDLNIDPVSLQTICQDVLSLFASHLPSIGASDATITDDVVVSRNESLDPRIIFKMAALCFMIVTILQNTGSRNLSLAIAFTVGFCTYVMNRTVTNLQSGLGGIVARNNERKDRILEEKGNAQVALSSDNDIPVDGVKEGDSPASTSGRTRAARPYPRTRRRRRRRSSQDQRSPGGSSDRRGRRLSSSTDLASDDSRSRSSDDFLSSPPATRSPSPANSDSGRLRELDRLRDHIYYVSDYEYDGFNDDDTEVGGGVGGDEKRLLNYDPLGAKILDFHKPISLPKCKQTGSFFGEANPVGIGDNNFIEGSFINLEDQLNNCLSQEANPSSNIDNAIDSLGSSVAVISAPIDGSNNNNSDLNPGADSDSTANETGESAELLSQKGALEDTSSSIFTTTKHHAARPVLSNQEENDAEVAMVNDIIDMISQDGLMLTIKIFANWLQSHNEILIMCSKSCQTMWNSFVALLNTFPNENHLKQLDAYKKLELHLMTNVESSVEAKTPSAYLLGTVSTSAWSDKNQISRHFPDLSHLCGGKKDGPCLREDLALFGFMPLRAAQNHLLFQPSAYPSLDSKTETLVRIMQLREFGHFLSDTKEIDVMYDTETDQFFNTFTFRDKEIQTHRIKALAANEINGNVSSYPALSRRDRPSRHSAIVLGSGADSGEEAGDIETQITKQTNEQPTDGGDQVAKSKKANLMRLMGNLRLKCIVPANEQATSGESRNNNRPSHLADPSPRGQSLPPPYLLPDTHVLCEKLALIKTLLASHNFIVVLPRAVLDLLDILKKESSRARRVIRWLEAELRDGNKYLHVQTDSEIVYDLKFGKEYDERDKKIRLLCDMIRCGKYFVSQGSTFPTETVMALVLTFDLPGKVEERFKKPSIMHVMEGLDLMDIVEFFSRWKKIRAGEAEWSDFVDVPLESLGTSTDETFETAQVTRQQRYRATNNRNANEATDTPKYRNGHQGGGGHFYYRKRQDGTGSRTNTRNDP